MLKIVRTGFQKLYVHLVADSGTYTFRLL